MLAISTVKATGDASYRRIGQSAYQQLSVVSSLNFGSVCRLPNDTLVDLRRPGSTSQSYRCRRTNKRTHDDKVGLGDCEIDDDTVELVCS